MKKLLNSRLKKEMKKLFIIQINQMKKEENIVKNAQKF